MSYEISTITESGASHNYPVVSGQANMARYAVAALKSSITSALSISKNLVTPYKFNQETLLGVDITPSCIYVCQVDNKSGGRALTGLASVCMEGKFVGEDILSNPDLYSEKLKKLLLDNKIHTTKVAVSLPVSSSIVKVVTISKMDDADIARAIKYGSLWQNLMSQDDSPDNYSIFYQVVRREETSETMDILLVATKLADIRLYKDIVMKSGLNPVVIDAKSVALHYAFKNRPCQSGRHGTVLIEFGLDDNYIMVMGDARPRIFTMDISETERAAILGVGASGDAEIVAGLINRYSQRLRAIITACNRIKPGIAIEEIYVMSSLPLVGDFVRKLSAILKDCQVRECCMFDYLLIPDSFSISQDSAKRNISAWAGAISMAVFPWAHREEWIEIKKTPACGTQYFRHNKKPLRKPDLAFRMADFSPYESFHSTNQSTLARLTYPNFMAVAAAALSMFVIVKSYYGVLEDGRQLAASDIAIEEVAANYQKKIEDLAALQNFTANMADLEIIAQDIAKGGNQQYLISMYGYLDTILQEGVWLKQLTFTAPDSIEIEGRSIDDLGVMAFLNTIDGSKMFSKIALKHIQSIREMDLYTQNSLPLKSFIFKGNLAEPLPGEHQG